MADGKRFGVLEWLIGAQWVSRDVAGVLEPAIEAQRPETGSILHAVTGDGAACRAKNWGALSPALRWPPPSDGPWEACIKCLEATQIV